MVNLYRLSGKLWIVRPALVEAARLLSCNALPMGGAPATSHSRRATMARTPSNRASIFPPCVCGSGCGC